MKVDLTEIRPGPKDEPTYPYLGRSTANAGVVFFTSRGEGWVLFAGDVTWYNVGYYANNWNEVSFERLPPSTSVTLSNSN